MVYFIEVFGLFYLAAFIWFWFACRSSLRRTYKSVETAENISNLIPFERGIALRMRKTQWAVSRKFSPAAAEVPDFDAPTYERKTRTLQS